jgi:small subunit ribosomal protein S1
VVQEGQQVKLRIISLDSERHRLGLSLKQAEDRPAPAPREERPRRERPQRRDRFDYRPEDATAEPEGGIDSSMAAAFASSGVLDQFRSEAPEAAAERQAEEAKPEEAEEVKGEEAEPAAEAAAEAVAEIPEGTTEPAAETEAEAPAEEPTPAEDAAPEATAETAEPATDEDEAKA